MRGRSFDNTFLYHCYKVTHQKAPVTQNRMREVIVLSQNGIRVPPSSSRTSKSGASEQIEDTCYHATSPSYLDIVEQGALADVSVVDRTSLWTGRVESVVSKSGLEAKGEVGACKT